MNPRLLIPLIGVIASGGLAAVPAPANTDENKVPAYTLPDPLVCADGTVVRDAAMWRDRRRPELLELFAREVYGRTPAGRPEKMHWDITSIDRAALGGKAVRKQITIWFTAGRDGPKMDVLIYQPVQLAGATPRPLFLGLNYFGNLCVNSDPGIAMSSGWMREAVPQGIVNHHATEKTRGSHASRWQVESVLARGYATATAYYGDLCPDRVDGLPESVGGALFHTAGPEARAGDDWGALGIWAWGLSRIMDYVATDQELDARRVAVHGHSRLGKAALWAAAQDERFSLVISNDSGCGGAALSKRIYGETVGLINRSFPYWFAKNFRRFDDNESALPLDQHELLALIAPRPLYVASALGDQWADPRGEFLSTKATEPVYRLFGLKGLGVEKMPPVDTPASAGALAYHMRTGIHDITAYDWAQYLDFADAQWK